jgi:hypothetical protein
MLVLLLPSQLNNIPAKGEYLEGFHESALSEPRSSFPYALKNHKCLTERPFDVVGNFRNPV